MFTFIIQILTIFSVVVTSLINLSMCTGDQKLWLTLLAMSLGCILPAPKLPTDLAAAAKLPPQTDIKVLPVLENLSRDDPERHG